MTIFICQNIYLVLEVAYYLLLIYFIVLLKSSVIEIEEKIINATLKKSEKRFANIAHLHKLVIILMVEISCIINFNHRDIIPTSIDEVISKM